MFAVSSQQSATTAATDSLAPDHVASSTLLSNVCHVMDVAAIAWRAYRLPSADHLLRSLSIAHTACSSKPSAPHTPLFRARHALHSLWSSPTASSDGLCYTLQQLDGATSSSATLLLFVCHIRSSSSSEPAALLPGEEQLSQYAADGDELPVPLSFSARLFSAAFSSPLLSLLSAALCDTIVEQSGASSATPSLSPASMRLVLLDRCLCVAVLSVPSQSFPSLIRRVPTVPPAAVAQPSSSSAAPARPATGTAVLPRIVSPSAYLSPPDTSQMSLPSPDPSEAADMADDATAAPPISHSPQPLTSEHTKASTHATAPSPYSLPSAADADGQPLPALPSYLARFVHGAQRGTSYRSPHVRQSSVGRSDEPVVHLKPDILADLALSINTFPSLSSLSASTRRSLAIVSTDHSNTAHTASTRSTPAYTLHSADSEQLLGPPPLSAVALTVPSPNTPGSMPALSPVVDDGKLSPSGADLVVATTLAETVQHLPFSPWTIDTARVASDAMDTDGELSGASYLAAYFIRFIKQQTLAPLAPSFLLSTASTAGMSTPSGSSRWQTVQRWLSGCSLLGRAFPRCRPFPLLANQLSLPAFEQRKPPPSPHDSSTSPSTSSSPLIPPLPLVSLPLPRLVFGFESELRDVPASAVSLYTQSSLRPALTAKDAVYAIVMPINEINDAVADDKRVDVWFDALSAVYENGGLGRHRPLNGHGRSGVLKLRSIYDVLKERAEALESTPATPASPMDSGTASNAASPRAGSSSMIVLSSDEPSLSRLTLPLSRSRALHSSAAPDGMRRFYQSVVAAVIAELDEISKGQGAEQLDRFDALVLYIVVDDKLQQPHDVRHMSDYLSCLHFDRHTESSSAAALSQLEQMDIVVRLLPQSALSSFSSPSFTSLSLSVYGSIRRLLDRVDSDSDVELPKHVEQLYEPVTYIADKRVEGKDDAIVEASSGTCTLVCAWTVQASRLLACACDDRGQVMDSFVCEGTGALASDVRQCWAQCVLTVWTMARRHRQVQQSNVLLVQWVDDSTHSSAAAAGYEKEWTKMLIELGYSSIASTDLPSSLPLMADAADTKRSSATQPVSVTMCSLAWDAAFSVLALRDVSATPVSTNVPISASASSSSSSAARQALLVEGINAPSSLASHWLPLPPHALCSPAQHRVPLASGLLFPHRTADTSRSTLARPVSSPLPAHTGTPLLLSLHDQLAMTSGADRSLVATPLTAAHLLLSRMAEQLQQLSFVSLPLVSVVGEGEEMDVDSGSVPLPVCVVARLARLVSSCCASA